MQTRRVLQKEIDALHKHVNDLSAQLLATENDFKLGCEAPRQLAILWLCRCWNAQVNTMPYESKLDLIRALMLLEDGNGNAGAQRKKRNDERDKETQSVPAVNGNG